MSSSQQVSEQRSAKMLDDINEIILYINTVSEFDKDAGQDGQALNSYLIELTGFMARSNFLMAEYNRIFRGDKKLAYQKLAASSASQQKYFAPSLAKDYVDAQCSDSGYVYDLAERCSRLCVHTADCIRTIISALKSERQFANHG